MLRSFALAVVLALGTAATAAAQSLAGPLVQFAGSQSNFDSLMSGLERGMPVMLSSNAIGQEQIVSFLSPTGPLTEAQATRALQLARTQLVSEGVTQPTPADIQAALIGGALPGKGVVLPGVLQGDLSSVVLGAPSASGGATGPATPGENQPSLEVLRLAPQLLAFAGSQENFDMLANGLAQGREITLTSVTPQGFEQQATFTPQGGPMSPSQVAQVLETARQRLIQQGIARPTPEQIGRALLGGAVATSSGQALLAPLLPGAPGDLKVQVQRLPALPPSFGGGLPLQAFAGSQENLARLLSGLQQSTPITLEPVAGGQPETFAPPGGPMSPLEAIQSLELASRELVAQGITAPTPQDIRAALVGGTIVGAAGAPVELQGVLLGAPAVSTSAAGQPVAGNLAAPAIGPGNDLSNSVRGEIARPVVPATPPRLGVAAPSTAAPAPGR